SAGVVPGGVRSPLECLPAQGRQGRGVSCVEGAAPPGDGRGVTTRVATENHPVDVGGRTVHPPSRDLLEPASVGGRADVIVSADGRGYALSGPSPARNARPHVRCPA